MTDCHGIWPRSTHALAGHCHATSRTWAHTSWYTAGAWLHAHHRGLCHVWTTRARDAGVHLHWLAHRLNAVWWHARMAMWHSRLHTSWVGRERHALHHRDGGVARCGRVGRGSDAKGNGEEQDKERGLFARTVASQLCAAIRNHRHVLLESSHVPSASSAAAGRERAFDRARSKATGKQLASRQTRSDG